MRVAIVGAGRVAHHHADAFAHNPQSELVAIVEPASERGEAFARQHGLRPFASLQELLDAGRVDAVSICAPHHLHRELACLALRHGLHVLLEKPIATSVADGEAIVAEAQRAGTVLMLGFVHRFRSEATEARRLIAEGAVGKPVTLLDRFCSLGGEHPPAWVWSRASAGGGVLMYGGIHALDRLRWLLGSEVTAVTARVHHTYGFGDVEDGLVALLDVESGATASLVEASPPFGRPGGWITEVIGSEGAVRVQTGEWVELVNAAGTERHPSADDDHFRREIDEFVDAIVVGRTPSVTGADGLASLAIADAIYRSAASGRTERVCATAG